MRSCGYVIGSYKYDLLNDVLSMLILGDTGSACIINEKGTIIADQDEKNIADQVSIYDKNSSSKNKEIYDRILSYQTGSVTMKRTVSAIMSATHRFRERTGFS